MTSLTMPVEVMIANRSESSFCDFAIEIAYTLDQPYEVQLVFDPDLIWRLDVDVFQQACAGQAAGSGDAVWEPATTVQSCMRLRLSNDSGEADVVFSRADLSRVWDAVDALRVANPTLAGIGCNALPVRVEEALDRELSRILEI